MSLISNKIAFIKPSPTLEISKLTAELIAQGRDVISLGAGEPDFDTPDHIKATAIQAINSGFTKYTPVDGISELRRAIIHRMKEDYGINYALNQVLVGSGAKQCIYNLLMATLNDGDEVIIPAPYWVSYPDMVKIAGGTPVIVDCGDTFKITPELLERAITQKTKWLIINSPSNPAGTVYGRDELTALAKVLLKHEHVNILTDDIYAKLVYDCEFLNILQVEESLYNRVFIINGVSKAYSMTGWRIGYVVGDANVIKAVSVIQSQSTTNANSIAQKAATTALEGDHEFLRDRIKAFARRRDKVMQTIGETAMLSADIPQGAFYVFVSCAGAIGKKAPSVGMISDGTDMSKHLLHHDVAVVPGVAFGAQNFFRISYALSDEKLATACQRILDACSELQ
ncbi:pyridoxal phosphate-dependent aminotransferase [Anaplasma bovis]|uniref:pyridoxal phosphate-dependent aminotransferase n=1 Tax=Anaplasma bovis TaxID=186733 RepID=UPI002FEF2D43